VEFVKPNLSDALLAICRVNFALMLRETKTRYGRLQIGYIWAFLEPILVISVLSVVFKYIRMREMPGMPLAQFLISGFIPFMLFRDIVTQSMTGVRRNLQLLYFPQVQIMDFFTARTLLEFSTTLVVFPTLVFLVAFTGYENVIVHDILGIFLGLIMISIFGFGIGIGLGALVPLFPSLQIMVQSVYLRPLFFLSGVFFTIDMIPEAVRPYASLNPILQIIEYIRSSYFVTYESTYVDFKYLFFTILGTLLVGLLLQRAFRRYAYRI